MYIPQTKIIMATKTAPSKNKTKAVPQKSKKTPVPKQPPKKNKMVAPKEEVIPEKKIITPPLEKNITPEKMILDFISISDNVEGLSLEGIVDAIAAHLTLNRTDIEATVLKLREEGFITQTGNNKFDVSERGKKKLSEV